MLMVAALIQNDKCNTACCMCFIFSPESDEVSSTAYPFNENYCPQFTAEEGNDSLEKGRIVLKKRTQQKKASVHRSVIHHNLQPSPAAPPRRTIKLEWLVRGQVQAGKVQAQGIQV